MSTRIRASLPAILLTLAVWTSAGALQPQSTGSISGVVVDDADRPVRRAVVSLTGDGLQSGRGTVTDDEGRFELRGLPPGRFTLVAERGAYIASEYGAKRPGRAGTPISLAPGQQMTNLGVRLWRGAVLSGVVFDASGAPYPFLPVSAVPAREVTPAALTLSNNGQTRTNDAGEYRIFGLEPGTYLVRAGSVEFVQTANARSEAEVDAVFAALTARGARSGAIAAPDVAPLPPLPPPSTVSPAPIFYPGTPVLADATPVALAAGDERTGLDFTVAHVPVATIRGAVARPDGAPLAGAFVRLAVATRPDQFASAGTQPLTAMSQPDGRFELGPVSPGQYTLLVRGSAGGAAGPGAGGQAEAVWWASMPLSVSGIDVDLATLPLQPGMTMTGRVEFDGTTTPPDLASLRIQMEAESVGLAPAQGRGRPMVGNARYLRPAAVRADRTFVVTDLVPDEYRLTASGSGVGSGAWWLRSAIHRGRDLLDVPLQLAPGEDLRDVVLIFSDRRTELSGSISTSAGAAVSDLFVLAYPADARLRVRGSRRVLAARPDSGGRFVLAGLPPGDYLLAALTDVDEGEWNDPGFLERLVEASVPIALADGERRVQDLQIGGGAPRP